MKTLELPQTDSIEELARFWDTHNLTDFEDQLEEVPEQVFQRPSSLDVNIRLTPDELNAAAQIARSGGRDLAVLLHDWVIEKLQEALATRRQAREAG